MVMVRQCAWCLCLINNMGERISSSPLPKLYEASHGICSACGTAWLMHAIETSNIQNSIYTTEEINHTVNTLEVGSEIDYKEQQGSLAQFILQLQQSRPQQFSVRKGKGQSSMMSG